MRGVLATEALWRQERGAIEQEVARDYSNPQYLFYSRLLAQMFAGTPYAHDALGTRPSFQKTTGAMLKDFHRKWYAPNNAILVIVGDIDPAAALTTVKQLFEPIAARTVPPRPKISAATFKSRDDRGGLGPAVRFRRSGVSMPGFNDPDYAAGVVLADAFDSRRGELYALAAEGKALSGGFDAMALPAAGFGYAKAGFPRGQDSTALIAQMKALIAGYVDKGVSADLVEATKRREVAEAEFRRNSIAGLAAEWSQTLSVEGRASVDDDIEAIKQVTVADVNRVARKYLINDSAVTAIMTPHESGEAVASEAGALWRGVLCAEADQSGAIAGMGKENSFALVVPSSTVNPSVTVLPNGLRLIVQPETISDTVTVYGGVKNRPELQVPAGKEGADQILDELFAYGSTKLDRIAFQEALDEIGATAQVGNHFSLEALPDVFARGVELLADNLLHPALPEAAPKRCSSVPLKPWRANCKVRFTARAEPF